MPCDSIQLAQVHLGACNQEILKKTLEGFADPGSLQQYAGGWAFRKDGAYYRVTAGGDLVGRDASMADRVRQAYSKQVIKTGAAKFGWEVNAKSPTKLTVRRKF